MINSIGMQSMYYPSMVSPQSSAGSNQNGEELTTVTTHCNKNHKHTPECPHTTLTRPANSPEGVGKYLDVFA